MNYVTHIMELPVACSVRDGQNPTALSLNLTVHDPAAGVERSGCAILYFHGGGLLYGERDDLPVPYIERITGRGHVLVCLDYPLAPECPLTMVLDCLDQAVVRFVRTDLAMLGCSEYALFGRSAGGYLAIKLASRLREYPDLVQPSCIWDFYGYWDLTAPFLNDPSAYYRKLPPVSAEDVGHIVDHSDTPVLNGPKSKRFSLYIHARQEGRWGAMLGLTLENASALSLSRDDIAALPPVFITASTGDQDVPLRQSKTLMRLAPRRLMYQVYDLEHDFDRDTLNPAGAEAYEKALDFLDESLLAPKTA